MKIFKSNLNLEVIQFFLLVIYLFFSIKAGGDSRMRISVLFMLFVIARNFFENYKFEFNKPMIIFSLGYIFFFTISFIIGKDFSWEISRTYLDVVCFSFVFSLVISQMHFTNITRKYYLFLVSTISLLPVIRAIDAWQKVSFSSEARISSGTIYVGIFAAEAGFYAIFSFVGVLFYKNKKLKFLLALIFIVCLIAVVSTHSRASLFILIISVFLGCFLYFKKLGIYILFIAIVSGILVFKIPSIKNQFSRFNISEIKNDSRVNIYKKILTDELSKKTILFGKGYRYYLKNPLMPETESFTHLHNSFLEILVTQGLFSLVFYLGYFFYFLLKTFRAYRVETNRERKLFLLLGFIGVTYVLLNGLFDATIFFRELNYVLYLMIGINMSLWLNKKDINQKN
ncbi:MAG: O-antigen ligase family protein [Fusobacteriaceae bacterium]